MQLADIRNMSKKNKRKKMKKKLTSQLGFWVFFLGVSVFWPKPSRLSLLLVSKVCLHSLIYKCLHI